LGFLICTRTSYGRRSRMTGKWAELHLVHHSADPVNTRCLRRSVRPCSALRVPGRRTAAVTRDFTGRLDLMQR